MVHTFKRKEQKTPPNYTDYKTQQLAQGREQYVTSTPSANAWQRMQTLFSLVNYAEKWVQVSPMDSPGELQLARKHVVVFVVLVSELSWEGGQSSQEAEWKIPCQIPVLLTVVWGRAFTMLFVLFFPGSGRKLLSGIWSPAPHIVLALAPMAGQVKDGPACQEMWQPYHKVNPLYMAFFCKAGRAGPVQFFHNTGRKIQTML